jgi:hypothetical protein
MDKRSITRKAILVAALLVSCVPLYGQNAPAKKNARPVGPEKASDQVKPLDFVPVFRYEFKKPEFVVSHVVIEHDEAGIGKITFEKRDAEESITDPIQLSQKTLTFLQDLWAKLDFLNSREVYQSPERDYGHLGTMELTMRKDGRERTVTFNWTENPEAKALTDEYRKIGNQFIWIFDMNVARRNQPLETPRIMNGLDSYLRRDSLADPGQMLPYLNGLKDDERIPLIARNHAARIIDRIEKEKKKEH